VNNDASGGFTILLFWARVSVDLASPHRGAVLCLSSVLLQDLAVLLSSQVYVLPTPSLLLSKEGG